MLEAQKQTTSTHGYPETLSDSQLRVTVAAAAKFKELLREAGEPNLAVRVFVSGGGCGGMAYGMTFTEERTRHDSLIQGDGYEIRIDAVTLNYLKGSEIDFRDNGVQSSFVFNNVFQSVGGSGTCGACGSSGGGCH
ncbi:MAG: HesB/IscA family protein [Acidiferrobacteraceae bacterium]